MLALASLATAFALTSPAFTAGGTIPKRHTCDGSNKAPLLRHTAPPKGTRALALELIDPDAPVAGGFVHWLWAVRPGIAGRNSAGGLGYTGPCPPPGPAHHYVFRLYALDAKPRLAPGFDDTALRRAIRGHVLATARLVGRYRR
jgi:phosphatidylethanolamine-binding protein (PEBP) family uncharacterized protein